MGGLGNGLNWEERLQNKIESIQNEMGASHSRSNPAMASVGVMGTQNLKLNNDLTSSDKQDHLTGILLA